MIFDELDRALLKELQNHARQSNAELAVAVGVPPAKVADRVQALLEHGVILGYRAEIDVSAAGRPMQALLSVRIRISGSNAVGNFRAWVETRPEILNLFVTSGSSDFILHLAVPSAEDLYVFITDHLVTQPAVFEVRTSLVFEHIHRQMVEPVDEDLVRRHRKLVTTPPRYST
ncbi:MAG TPA: Lrp/AsnC family transcriptional regulator [Pseudonocardiaceae bacterium]|nr:Lrp/AsnC family transcriptional regulator [Pseudonocardiaceae bacterium]